MFTITLSLTRYYWLEMLAYKISEIHIQRIKNPSTIKVYILTKLEYILFVLSIE